MSEMEGIMSSKQSNCLLLLKRECKRFMDKVDVAISRDRKEVSENTYQFSTSEMAAVKRASLDLSKMLSEFRKLRR